MGVLWSAYIVVVAPCAVSFPNVSVISIQPSQRRSHCCTGKPRHVKRALCRSKQELFDAWWADRADRADRSDRADRAEICCDLSGTCKVAKFCSVLSLQLCILIYLSLWFKAWENLDFLMHKWALLVTLNSYNFLKPQRLWSKKIR